MPQPSSKRFLTEDRGLVVTTVQATQYSLSADGTTRQQAATLPPAFGPVANRAAGDIVVDPGITHQPILGFGAALTGASAYNMIAKLTPAQRSALIKELYSPTQLNLSMVLIPMGASDFDANAYTYDDVPLGSTDTSLASFTVAMEETGKIAILREILAVNPRVKVIASPWTSPAWMKSSPGVGLAPGNGNTGNTLAAANFAAYAQYFVKFIQAYAAHGIPIYAVAPQNEPQSGSQGWPSLFMSAADQATFIGANLGPAFDAAGITTRIICFKHNWGGYTYADTVLSDTTANQYIDGVGWHWYSSAPEGTQSVIARKYPTKAQYFLEACDSPSIAGTVANYFNKIFVGSMRAGSRCALLWNIALDENGRPHNRQDGVPLHGLITIPSSGSGAITRTTDYYSVAQQSKFVQAGAVRINSSDTPTGVRSVAYLNPDGTIVTVVYNGTGASTTFQVIDARGGQGFPATLPAGEVATFVWKGTPVGTAAPSIAVPGAPTVTVIAATGSNTIAFTGAAANGAPIANYIVYSGTSAANLTPLAVLPGTAVSYSDINASTTAATYYAVAAVNAGGIGTQSTAGSATATNPDTRIAPPATLTKPVLWLRADKITGVADGGNVNTIPDTSGNGYHAALPSGGTAPLLKTNAIGALPVVQFTGGKKLVAPFQHIATNLCILMVARMPSTGANTLIYASSIADGSAKSDTGFSTYYSTGSKTFVAQAWQTGNGTYNNAAGPNGAVPTANVGFIARTFIDSNLTMTTAMNGAAGAPSAKYSAYTPSTALALALGAAATDNGTVDIAEVIMLRNPTAAEIAAWTTYLGSVYGITLAGSN